MMSHLWTAVLVMTLPGQAPAVAHEGAIQLDDYAPCGLTTLYLVCKIRGNSATWGEVKQAMGQPGPDGELNFAEMAGAAERVGLHPVALEAGRAAFDDLPMPAIVQVHDSRFPDELPHFLVLLRPESDGMWLLDAPFPAYFLPEDRFKQSWTGKIMIFAESQAEADRIKETSNRYDVVMWAASVLLVVGLLPIGYITIKWVKRIGPNMARGLAVLSPSLNAGVGEVGPSKNVIERLVVPFI